jgi:uroporphyrinogen-III synthase
MGFAVTIRQPQAEPADWLAVASEHSTAELAEARKNNRPANWPKQL